MLNTAVALPIEEFISTIVHTGSAYDLEGMDTLYAADHSILILNGDGTVACISRSAMLDEFRSRRDAGEPPLSTEYRVLHVVHQGENAVAILFRLMSPEAHPVMYEIRLRKDANGWLVTGETVTPWPDPNAEAGSFLPPRKAAANVTENADAIHGRGIFETGR